ncbi:MAG: hypothetical protein ABII12_05890 [Planctomycetota bacterium]
MTAKTKSRLLFVVGAVLGFTGAVLGLVQLSRWHAALSSWEIRLKEDPRRSELHRLRQERIRFIEDARRRMVELPPEYRETGGIEE